MAYEVNANGAIAKVRNPWGVLGLSLITLGIYTIFWYYNDQQGVQGVRGGAGRPGARATATRDAPSSRSRSAR